MNVPAHRALMPPSPTRRRVLLGAAAMAAQAPGMAWAQQPPPAAPVGATTVRMGYTNSLWPLSRGEDDGGAAGLLVDLMGVVATRAGLALRNRAYPWARAQLMVAHGELDGFCTVRTQERMAYARFCTATVASFRVGVFHRADDLRPRDVRAVEDLRALRHGTYLGNGYAKENLEWQRLRVENDEDSVLRLIAMGALDVFVSVEFTGVPHLVKLGLQDKLRFTPLPFLPLSEYRFGLRSSFADCEAVVARMDAAVVAAAKAGELGAQMRRYKQVLKEAVGYTS